MRPVFGVLLLLLLAACVTSRDAQFEAAMNEQVGQMSYDEALTIWGEPASITDGDEVFLVVWRVSRNGPYYAGQVGNGIAVGRSSKTYELALAFDKETRVLRAWNSAEY